MKKLSSLAVSAGGGSGPQTVWKIVACSENKGQESDRPELKKGDRTDRQLLGLVLDLQEDILAWLLSDCSLSVTRRNFVVWCKMQHFPLSVHQEENNSCFKLANQRTWGKISEAVLFASAFGMFLNETYGSSGLFKRIAKFSEKKERWEERILQKTIMPKHLVNCQSGGLLNCLQAFLGWLVLDAWRSPWTMLRTTALLSVLFTCQWCWL